MKGKECYVKGIGSLVVSTCVKEVLMWKHGQEVSVEQRTCESGRGQRVDILAVITLHTYWLGEMLSFLCVCVSLLHIQCFSMNIYLTLYFIACGLTLDG